MTPEQVAASEPLAHFFHCWRSPSHHACAVELIERQSRDHDALLVRAAPAERLPTAGRVVCLCGPARFGVAYQVALTAFAIAGDTVIGTPDLADALSRLGPAEMKTAIKAVRRAHLRLIDLADQVHVLNPGGYIAPYTRREIAYALEHGKPVTYLEAPVG